MTKKKHALTAEILSQMAISLKNCFQKIRFNAKHETRHLNPFHSPNTRRPPHPLVLDLLSSPRGQRLIRLVKGQARVSGMKRVGWLNGKCLLTCGFI